MNLTQCSFGIGVARQIIGVGQFLVPMLLLILGEMLADVSTLVKLAPLDEDSLTPLLLDGRSQCATTVNDRQHALLETESPLDQPIQQLIADLLVLCGSLMKTQYP